MFARSSRPVFVLVVFLTSSAVPAAAAGGSDWPRFLGPAGDGKSPETGVDPSSWGGDGPPLLWHLPVGEGYAAPSVADGRLFVLDAHGSTARLTCRDARTGEERWRSEYATAYDDLYGYSNGPRAAPLVDGERVYTFDAGGRLRCLRVEDGELLWEVDTTERFGVVQNFFGAASAPVIDGELLIAAVGGSPPDSPDIMSGRVVPNGTAIVAFDKRTGEVRYTTGDELASYSSPVVTEIGGRRLGLYFARGGLLAFDPVDGGIVFHYPFRARKLESVNAANPIVVDDTVFVTESYGPGSVLLRVGSDGAEVLRRDANTREQSMSCHFMTPIHHEGYLYGSHGQGSGEAELRAVKLATGEVAWREPGLGRATLLWVDGHLVVYTERGRLLLVEATPTGYRPLVDTVPRVPVTKSNAGDEAEKSTGEARTEETETADHGLPRLLPYPAWSPPVLSHGILYLRAKGRLAAFRLIAEQAAAPAACSEHDAFSMLDFWVGEWDVFAGGRQVGTNRIEKVLAGCAVVEHWTGAGGGEGKSLFYYLPVEESWKQVWVTERALRTGGVKEKRLIETLDDGGLRFQGTIPQADGGSYLDRTTLRPLPGGEVGQRIEISRDGGESWESVFDAVYRRRAAARDTPSGD